MKRFMLAFTLLTFMAFYACQSDKGTTNTGGDTAQTQPNAKPAKSSSSSSGTTISSKGGMSKNGITLTPFSSSPAYSDATLKLNAPKSNAHLHAGKIGFDFDVANYDLGNQTSDAPQKNCANSAKGQHIHLILNNEPYSAWYTNKFEKDLKNSYYVGLAFLSRSYHESIKSKGAYQLFDFAVGHVQKPDVDFNAPHMFYSRPKGNYIGKGNIEKVMLDFYLVNTNLSPNGNRVRATINGNSFILTKWIPYYIEGLKMGVNTVKLELLDKDNKPVPGPFNVVERTINLSEEEPVGK